MQTSKFTEETIDEEDFIKERLKKYLELQDEEIDVEVDSNNIEVTINKKCYTYIIETGKIESETVADESEKEIIGEIYTTITNGGIASIKVISYVDNIEKEIMYTSVINTPQEFTDFSVSYNRSELKWHIKSDCFFGYSSTNSTDFSKYIRSNDISWSYTENVHYYITNLENWGYYRITYEMNNSIAETPSYYNNKQVTELPIPIRDGYTFIGWTGSNGTTPQISTKIRKRSKGDKHYIANFVPAGPFIAEVYTKSTHGSFATLTVEEYYPYSKTDIFYSGANKSFSNFSITYPLKWKLTPNSDNVYYTTSVNAPISEYKKLDTLNWAYNESVHYYIAIK